MKVISAQKVEQGSIKNQIDYIRSNAEHQEIINKVKEVEKIRLELLYKISKLAQLNENQYEGAQKETFAPEKRNMEEVKQKQIELGH